MDVGDTPNFREEADQPGVALGEVDQLICVERDNFNPQIVMLNNEVYESTEAPLRHVKP